MMLIVVGNVCLRHQETLVS